MLEERLTRLELGESCLVMGLGLLGQFAVKHSGKTFVDTVSGQMQYIPDSSIFVYGLVFILLAVIPLLLTRHRS